MSKNKDTGFTLIEILIALLIFALVAVITTVGLSTVLKTRERSNQQTQQILQLQLTLLILQQDFSQMVVRPIVDNTGNQSPAFLEQPTYIEFTRAGYLNPLMAEKRSTLQRVAYLFKNHQLIRRTWPVLDRAPETQVSERILLKNISTLQFTYLTQENQFTPSWPPPARELNNNKHLPKAIKMDFTFTKLGQLTYLFLITAIGNN